MAEKHIKELAKILQAKEEILEELEEKMGAATGKEGVLERIYNENESRVEKFIADLAISKNFNEVTSALREKIYLHEKQLLEQVNTVPGKDIFDKSARLSKEIANVGKGLFLKREYAERVLHENKPENLLSYLKKENVDEVLGEVDVLEAFSALRFVESNEWMHKTFETSYSDLSPDNFEEREIEIKVLGPRWKEIAKKFVAEKHHNLSHLKEFGVIFLNPIKENVRGAFFRDFALILHYCHEIEFYSKLFREHLNKSDFSEKFKSLLRGDVPELVSSIQYPVSGIWLIIQRYLWKDDPSDPRLSVPHVNSESMIWKKAERDLIEFSKKTQGLDLDFWENSDWASTFLDGRVVSFDMEDNAMSAFYSASGKGLYLTYHQHEALWNKIFAEYIGGEEKMEELLVKNFSRGIIEFKLNG